MFQRFYLSARDASRTLVSRCCLHNHGGGVGRLVLEVSGEHLGQAVVTRQAVDAGLNENETELGVLVLAVLLEVLAHGNSLLDEAVEVLWEGWGEAPSAENAHDLVTGNHLDLGDAVGVPEDDANLGRSVTLLGHVADLLDGIGSGLLHPGRGGSFVWE